MTAEYEGNQTDDFTYLSIDVAQVPEGVHRLTATIKDVLTGEVVEEQVLFKIVE